MILIRWIKLKEARRFIGLHHRHRPKLTGGIVCLGAWQDGELVGVCVLGRPPARMDGPETVEITRLCTNGHNNLCSKLYSKAKRLAQALGFAKIKTFTKEDESGSSLFALGIQPDGITDGGEWASTGRPRTTDDPSPKVRWFL